jgi:small-conductance mechanosensitive channel
LTVTLLAVLLEFGIQTTSLVAILGAASLAVGRNGKVWLSTEMGPHLNMI